MSDVINVNRMAQKRIQEHISLYFSGQFSVFPSSDIMNDEEDYSLVLSPSAFINKDGYTARYLLDVQFKHISKNDYHNQISNSYAQLRPLLAINIVKSDLFIRMYNPDGELRTIPYAQEKDEVDRLSWSGIKYPISAHHSNLMRVFIDKCSDAYGWTNRDDKGYAPWVGIAKDVIREAVASASLGSNIKLGNAVYMLFGKRNNTAVLKLDDSDDFVAVNVENGEVRHKPYWNKKNEWLVDAKKVVEGLSIFK